MLYLRQIAMALVMLIKINMLKYPLLTKVCPRSETRTDFVERQK